ncbi:MAG: inactive serine/threonine-protein kinase VRK3 [Byssovorax sp.]
MTTACAQCSEPIRPGASFCGKCGLAQPALTAIAPALTVDLATLRRFEMGTRCMLRLRVENLGASPLTTMAIHAEARGLGPLTASSEAPLAAGRTVVLSLFVVPTMAGYEEITGALHATDAGGSAAVYRLDPITFRIGSAPHVQVVNIDQSGARVIDNSQSSFGGDAARDDAVITDEGGEWRAVGLTLVRSSPAAQPSASAPIEEAPAPEGPVDFEVKAQSGSYRLTSRVARGDLATVYGGARAGSSGGEVVFKLADDAADNDLLQAEVRTLQRLSSAQSPQSKHLPVVLDQVRTSDGRAGTVFERISGLDLCTLRERLPGGVPQRHLIWIMRRALSVLGWAHSNGILHGNVEPAHILVRPGDHNVWLIDWSWAIVEPAKTGQTFRCLNEDYGPPEARSRKEPLPSSDLYSLGKTMIYAAGGDPATHALPDTVDVRLQRFLRFFVVESALGRAADAWDMYKQLDNLREEVFGPHEFLTLEV